jgi:hypothetical protein
MIGFSLEFKRWYFVLRGPKGRVYLATGFAKRMPVFAKGRSVSLHDIINDDDVKYGTYRCDQRIVPWEGDETDEELLRQLKEIR